MNGNKNIKAVFSRLSYNVNITTNGNGSVTKELIMGALSYHKGDRIRLILFPNDGYDFDHWEGDLSGYELNPEVTVESDKNIHAVFTPIISYNDFIETADGPTSLMRGTNYWSKTTTKYNSPPYAWEYTPNYNYDSSMNLALTSRKINMTGSQNPYLLFWHRIPHSGIVGAHYVEISVDGGNNWSQLASYPSSTPDTMVLESISLSEYKNSNSIIIRFRPGNIRNAWYIDDIKIKDLTPFSNYYDDAEPGSTMMEPDGQWARTEESFHSPSNSWTDSPGAPYPDNSDTSLTTINLDLTGIYSPFLSFWHKYDVDSGDNCLVEISTDGGISWVTLKTYTEPYTGSDPTWTNEILDLSQYKANNVKIRFRLTTDHRYFYTQGDGWYIDDIMIF